MTKKEFERLAGRPPTQDDLQRVNCPQVGEIGHEQCGWCSVHNKPRFECGCVIEHEPLLREIDIDKLAFANDLFVNDLFVDDQPFSF